MSEGACDSCTARTWLLARLAGHIEKARSRIDQVLALHDDALLAAVGGQRQSHVARELETLDIDQVRARVRAAGLGAVCRCDPAYPPALRALVAPPAVLHVAGGVERLIGLTTEDPVAIVGARRASPYGLEVAGALGRSLAFAGITIVSGMAFGIDSAAHAGALEAGGPTVAVLPASADRPYPAAKRALHRRIVAGGAAVSELGPGAPVWGWMFPARNRIIAALAAMTVVVEAGERSGALATARLARGIGRPVGAVPGRVTTPQAAGPNGLLAGGACVVRGPQDVLDHLYGAGERTVREPRRQVPAKLRPLLEAIAEGHETTAALARIGFDPDQGLAALAELELGGFVTRGAGGRFRVAP
jgi:DNA processing protein